MNPAKPTELDLAPDEIAGADVIGGVVLGGLISMVIWAGIIGFFIL
jgi:hypothetical protein